MTFLLYLHFPFHRFSGLFDRPTCSRKKSKELNRLFLRRKKKQFACQLITRYTPPPLLVIITHYTESIQENLMACMAGWHSCTPAKHPRLPEWVTQEGKVTIWANFRAKETEKLFRFALPFVRKRFSFPASHASLALRGTTQKLAE